jgi:hypothetical protein
MIKQIFFPIMILCSIFSCENEDVKDVNDHYSDFVYFTTKSMTLETEEDLKKAEEKATFIIENYSNSEQAEIVENFDFQGVRDGWKAKL